MTVPADFWKGEGGRAYTERNRVDFNARVPFWQHILDHANANSFLEVGCNAGWNLEALKKLRPEAIMSGIDLNKDSLDEAYGKGFDVWEGSGVDLFTMADSDGNVLFPAGCCEMAFTCGVLIHVPPDELKQVMAAIRDVSSQYVVAVEYEDTVTRAIEYQGQEGLLWARPYGKLYEELGLSLIETGKAEGWPDGTTYWLLEK